MVRLPVLVPDPVALGTSARVGCPDPWNLGKLDAKVERAAGDSWILYFYVLSIRKSKISPISLNRLKQFWDDFSDM